MLTGAAGVNETFVDEVAALEELREGRLSVIGEDGVLSASASVSLITLD